MTLPIMLTILSYVLGTYFGYQGLRSPLDRPLLYGNETVLLVLTIGLGWAPIIVAIYFAYKVGLLFLLMLLVVRFLVLPTLFNDTYFSLLNRLGF